MAWPRAEQWEMAEEPHMMQRPPLQCHDSEESRTNILTSSDRFILLMHDYNHGTPLQEKHCSPINTGTCSWCWFFRGSGLSLYCPGRVDGREGETCLPGHSTSETDSQGDGKELWSSVAQCGALGDPRRPLNAPDAYPFHTISPCVTNSRRSANGNG